MRNRCIVCGEELNEDSHLMLCKDMPASAQDIPSFEDLDGDEPVDLQLCQCPRCGLVQFDCEPVWYYRDVIRAGGGSSTMTELRLRQYSHFIEMCGLEGKKIIEVGCGQGEFLKTLEEFPVMAYGIEHKRELVDKAQAAGLNVWYGFTETAETIIDGAPYDAFLSFNFLEHQPDPNTMLRCIYNNLTKDGCGLITVPSLDYILANSSYYELLRDHIANYSEETLRFLLTRNGFEVLESTIVNQDTLSMIVRKSGQADENGSETGSLSEVLSVKRKNVDVGGLRKSFNTIRNQLDAYFDSRIDEGKYIAVWGASHQGFTILSTIGLGDKVSYIIDSAPFKQGRYAPASHIPIVAPDYFLKEKVDCILIIAPGYTDEIAGIIRKRFGKDVEIAAIRTTEIEVL